MRQATRRLGLVLAGLLTAGPLARGEDAVEGDLKRMQGAWTTDTFPGAATTFTFEGRTLKVKGPGVEYVITATLDEAAKPERAINLKTETSTNQGAEGKVSPGIYKFEGDDRLFLCFRVEGERPERFETQGFAQWNVDLRRPAADKPATPEPAIEEPAAADAEAPLPEGWPAVTRPGAVEVKRYPAHRSAILRAADAADDDGGAMFFPLFNHIQEKGIAMTTPVVMTFKPDPAGRGGARGMASMEFLYRRPDQGEAGPGVGKVVVEDRPAATCATLGLQGPVDEARFAASAETLRAWVAGRSGEWAVDGPPRLLGYHGPDTPPARQLYEVLLPVRPADEAKGPK